MFWSAVVIYPPFPLPPSPLDTAMVWRSVFGHSWIKSIWIKKNVILRPNIFTHLNGKYGAFDPATKGLYASSGVFFRNISCKTIQTSCIRIITAEKALQTI